MYNKGLEIFNKKVKEKWQNSSENYKRDNVSLVLSRVPAQKCLSKYFFRWFVSNGLRNIVPKETSNNAGAKSPKISLK